MREFFEIFNIRFWWLCFLMTWPAWVLIPAMVIEKINEGRGYTDEEDS